MILRERDRERDRNRKREREREKEKERYKYIYVESERERDHARPFVGVFQKSIFKRICQLLAINAPPNSCKNDPAAPRKTLGCPHEGPRVEGGGRERDRTWPGGLKAILGGEPDAVSISASACREGEIV